PNGTETRDWRWFQHHPLTSISFGSPTSHPVKFGHQNPGYVTIHVTKKETRWTRRAEPCGGGPGGRVRDSPSAAVLWDLMAMYDVKKKTAVSANPERKALLAKQARLFANEAKSSALVLRNESNPALFALIRMRRPD